MQGLKLVKVILVSLGILCVVGGLFTFNSAYTTLAVMAATLLSLIAHFLSGAVSIQQTNKESVAEPMQEPEALQQQERTFTEEEVNNILRQQQQMMQPQPTIQQPQMPQPVKQPTDSTKVACNICGKEFKNKAGLRMHYGSHA